MLLALSCFVLFSHIVYITQLQKGFTMLVFSLICMFLILLYYSFYEGFKVYDISCVDIDESWVQENIEQYATQEVTKKYKQTGKPILKKDGEYRSDFIRQCDKYKKYVISKCCDESCFNSVFCQYINRNYPSFHQKQLYEALYSFLHFEDSRIKNTYHRLVRLNKSITPGEFLEMKSKTNGDFVGVYIIYNRSRNMYYVGQAKKVLFRLNQHFTGHGNGDVYADYIYGDDFILNTIPLTQSGYSDLDLLEKDMIKHYDACRSGYNRTIGNS